jgi:predicted AAA+ superfamily ATPase
MALLRTLTTRLDRVLVLAERLLGEWTSAELAADALKRHVSFRWDASRGPGRLEPILRPAGFDLADLLGVEDQVEALDRNTRQFLAGLPYNNVLLYGDRGTGKSSAVRGLLARHAGDGLRLVEVDRSDFVHLPLVLRSLGTGEGYRFIIFCDDLSFGPGEPGFRELKAALEGSLEAPAENVCLIATSNRRHLVPETRAENQTVRVDEDGELQIGEALDEKLALADRFGLTLGFYAFNQPLYLRIVEHYLAKAGIGELDDQLRAEALRWALGRGSRNGRTARQFVDDTVGRRRLAERSARSV